MDAVERPVLRYFGGKWMLAPWILQNLPAHKTYVEPFGGGASILMRKNRSYAEIYNDRDGEIVNVFKQLRDNGPRLEELLRLSPWSRDEYDSSYVRVSDPIEQARLTIVRSAMGFADATTRQSKCGFRAVMTQGKAAADVWRGYPDFVSSFTKRLQGVVIENRDYWSVCENHDSPETLHFLDPPYVHSTRSGPKDAYKYEMTNLEHELMCERIYTLKGMVVLCGYDNPIYSSFGWKCIKAESMADGAKARIECLWLNPAALKNQQQQELSACYV